VEQPPRRQLSYHEHYTRLQVGIIETEGETMSKNYAQQKIDAEGERRSTHRDAVRINAASELLSQRMTGRHLGGGDVVVEYNPQRDTSYWSRTLVKFIEEHGSNNGVRVVRTNGR